MLSQVTIYQSGPTVILTLIHNLLVLETSTCSIIAECISVWPLIVQCGQVCYVYICHTYISLPKAFVILTIEIVTRIATVD